MAGSMLAFWLGGASGYAASAAQAGRKSQLAHWLGGASAVPGSIAITASAQRGGWDDYVAPRTRKTLKQYKKEYFVLSYIEIEQEKEKAASEIKLAESEIRFNRDLGLKDVIARLKEIIAIEKLKLLALEWVEQERIRRWKKAKQKIVDEDLVFIATYLMDENDD